MDDIWSIIVAVSTALTALFLSLEWYSSWRERRDKVWVVRFKEPPSNFWSIRVRAKKPEGIEDCIVRHDDGWLRVKDTLSTEPVIIYGGGAVNFSFLGVQPDDDDDGNIIVKERNRIIFKRKFKEIYVSPP